MSFIRKTSSLAAIAAAAATLGLVQLAGSTPALAATGAPVDTASTGVPAGAALTKHVGDIIVTTPGTVIDHMDIAGFVKVRAANVTIRNSIVRGSGPGSSNTGLIDANNAAVKNLVVQQTTLVPNTPSVWLDGIIGHDYTADHVEVYQTVDGFGVYNATGTKVDANVTIKSSWVHALSYFASDPNHSDGTHNDGIQVQGGAHVTISGNVIQDFKSTKVGDKATAAETAAPGTGILVQGNVSPVSDLLIENNYVDGGYYAIRIRSTVRSSPVGAISNNRLGRSEYNWPTGNKYQILVESKQDIGFTAPLTSNVWSDNGVALAEGKTTGIRYGNY